MAGGYGRGSRIPLEDRVRVGGDAPEPSVPQRYVSSPGPGRHCWVSVPVDGGLARPALLVAWRKDGKAGPWMGHVVYVAELRPGEWTVVMEWLPADRMTAAPPPA